MKESNFEKTYDSNDMVMFQTTCQCGSDDHILHVTVEDWHDGKDEPLPVVTFDFKCKRRDAGYREGFFEKIWERIKDACKILFTGQIVVDGSFIFRYGDNHLKDFRSALDEAIRQVEECSKAKGN